MLSIEYFKTIDSFLIIALFSLNKDLVYKKNVETVYERLVYEKNFLDRLFEHYQQLNEPGYSFTPQLQKELFNGMFVEDPLFMNDFTQSLLRELDETLKNKTRKEQIELSVSTVARVLEVTKNKKHFLNKNRVFEIKNFIYLFV